MKQLSREAFDRARRFLKTQARPLDRALFEYRFKGGSAESAAAELARFQNEDGGFGRALEPDLRTPTSSALATGIGLRMLKELKLRADHPMVQGAVRFLLATFDDQTQVWRVAPRDANSLPHAPWWHDERGSLARTFDDFQIIPRAEIVSLCYHFSTLVPAGWLDDVTERTVVAIETLDDANFGGGGDTLVYALRLAEAETLPQLLKDRLTPRLCAIMPTVVKRGALIVPRPSRSFRRQSPSSRTSFGTICKVTWITRSPIKAPRGPGSRPGPGVSFIQTRGNKPGKSGAVT